MKFLLSVYILLFAVNMVSNNESVIQKDKDCHLRGQIIKNAKQYLGTKYKYGGCDKNGFDCSGFVFYQYQKLNIAIPRSSKTQMGAGKKVKGRKIKVGDIVVFTGSKKRKKKPGHTGIVCKVNTKGDFDFIHSSSSGGVKISNIKENYYQERFLGVRDVLSGYCR